MFGPPYRKEKSQKVGPITTLYILLSEHRADSEQTARLHYCIIVYTGPAEVNNDWSGRTSEFYGRYFQKEAQKDYRVSSGVLLK